MFNFHSDDSTKEAKGVALGDAGQAFVSLKLCTFNVGRNRGFD